MSARSNRLFDLVPEPCVRLSPYTAPPQTYLLSNFVFTVEYYLDKMCYCWMMLRTSSTPLAINSSHRLMSLESIAELTLVWQPLQRGGTCWSGDSIPPPNLIGRMWCISYLMLVNSNPIWHKAHLPSYLTITSLRRPVV